jgi:hypothetical protein
VVESLFKRTGKHTLVMSRWSAHASFKPRHGGASVR